MLLGTQEFLGGKNINYSIKNGVLYPSLDPSIFELKYPNVDIEGRSVGDTVGIAY